MYHPALSDRPVFIRVKRPALSDGLAFTCVKEAHMQAIFKGKTYGPATIGERGQLVIPAELRKVLKIKAGDQLMVFAKLDKHLITLIPARDFSEFLARASKIISKLENRVSKKN